MDTYEKKYKEIVGQLKKAYLYAQTDSTKAVLEEIFPELKEPEDERIRKFLIQMAQNGHGGNKDWWNKCIAWLEMQGEKSNIFIWHNASEEPEEMQELLLEWESEDAAWHEVGFYHQNDKTYWDGERKIDNVTRWCYIEELLEKQGEPVEINPTEFDTRLQALIGKFDNLPKEELIGSLSFWLNVVQNDGTYKDEEKQGEQKSQRMISAEAKEAMYDKPDDKVEPKFKVKYAGSEYNVFETKDIAGVTFYGIEDEPNHIDYVKAENCEIIGGYGIKEGGFSIPTKPAMLSGQKPADEFEPKFKVGDRVIGIASGIQYYITEVCDDYYDTESGCIIRFCSQDNFELKEQKPTWSEEDEKIITGIINDIQKRLEDYPLEQLAEIYFKEIKWLKSLKERIGG